MRPHLEESLIEAISKIVRLNKNGLQSLNNDLKALAALKIDELGNLERVKKYIELVEFVDRDDSLFNLIAEDKYLKLKFS